MTFLYKYKKTKFRNDTNGSIAINAAIGTSLLAIAVGAAVDYSLLASKQSKLQGWADSTALATAVSGETNYQSYAESFMQSSPFPDAKVNALVLNGNLVVKLSQPQDLFFSGPLGMDPQNISADAEVPLTHLDKANAPKYNIALVLDTTNSMRGLGEMDALKDGANALISGVKEKSADGSMVSVVPFSTYVKIPKSNINQPWIDVPTQSTLPDSLTAYKTTGEWEGCMNSRRDGFHAEPDFVTAQGPRRLPGFFEGDRCGPAWNNDLLPLSTDFQATTEAVDKLFADGATYIPAGLLWGWRTLSPNAPFEEASQNPDAENVLVLFSDGQNTVYGSDTNDHSEGIYHKTTGLPVANAREAANGLTLALCQRIKAADIKIVTIAFRISQTDTDTHNVLRTCASPGLNYLRTDSLEGLVNIFEHIETNLNHKEVESVRLVR